MYVYISILPIVSPQLETKKKSYDNYLYVQLSFVIPLKRMTELYICMLKMKYISSLSFSLSSNYTNSFLPFFSLALSLYAQTDTILQL